SARPAHAPRLLMSGEQVNVAVEHRGGICRSRQGAQSGGAPVVAASFTGGAEGWTSAVVVAGSAGRWAFSYRTSHWSRAPCSRWQETERASNLVNRPVSSNGRGGCSYGRSPGKIS